jgi:hypothetical protein
MLILTVEEANQLLRERKHDLADKLARIAELEALVSTLNLQAQGYPDGSVERDNADGQHFKAQRQLDRARSDLPGLEAAVAEAEQRVFEARYLKVYREWLAAQDRQKALADQRGNLEAQIDDLKGRVEELDAGPIAETDTEARNLYRGLEGMAQTQPPATMADLNLAVRNILYEEELAAKEVKQPGGKVRIPVRA